MGAVVNGGPEFDRAREALRKGSPPDDSIIKVIADHYDLPNLTSQFQQVKYQMKQEDKMQEGAPKAAAAKAAAEA